MEQNANTSRVFLKNSKLKTRNIKHRKKRRRNVVKNRNRHSERQCLQKTTFSQHCSPDVQVEKGQQPLEADKGAF